MEHISESATGRIELRGMRAVGVIGVLPEERERAQPFEIDLDVDVDISQAAEHDALPSSVDYGPLAAIVDDVVRNCRAELLERVAGLILDRALELPQVIAAEVVVRKTRPPLPFDVATAAVRLRRSKSASGMNIRRRALLGLGSNMGDRRAHLQTAISSLNDVASVSHVYETDPVGGPANQGKYLNMVVALNSTLNPFSLLAKCQALEAAAGRKRKEPNGPRTLDVDLLWVDGVTLSSAELTIPHPRMMERRFVVHPLSDVAPDLVPQDWERVLPPLQVTDLGDL